ncbi:rod-binding protein [Limimaricola litoreus]|uniref:Rod-binding protein n=1 Tax=Limimaricola litoreus TaxID=2955316 RepID=A0A9X2FN36_9RHOB|nr:rod-binding protein [Limimaricola litoreus]MCP1167929.1 rod-binding protein [Limimaricola litoreus]
MIPSDISQGTLAPRPSGPALAPAAAPDRTDPLWQAAQALETGFLSELLRLSDPGAPDTGFGGGAGEEQFRSFLFQAQAERMVEAGGIGLAERLYAGLSRAAR